MTSRNGRKQRKKRRKVYQQPTAKQLSPEEAKAKLRPLADQGDKQAQEMLKLISQLEARKQEPDDDGGDDLIDKKKSA